MASGTVGTWDTVVIGPGLGSTAGDAWIDGVKIETPPVPEPASLLGLGLASLLVIRRRRK
jgi:hypothetical protein